MRQFIAVPFSDQMPDALTKMQDALRSMGVTGRRI